MNNLKEVNFKNCSYYYFHGIIKVEDFDFDNILLDEESYKNILIYDILYKTLIGVKPMCIKFGKVKGLVEFMMGLDIYYYLVLKNMIPTIGLDIS